MDPLSYTASFIAILQLSSKVLGYLNDVKDATKDCKQCTIEVANVHSLLTNLRFRLEEQKELRAQWYKATQDLAIHNGPLDQFKQALEQLESRLGRNKGRVRRVGNAIVWAFKKEEVANILARIERLKKLVMIALEMDH